jgi:hypothetical protein
MDVEGKVPQRPMKRGAKYYLEVLLAEDTVLLSLTI